MLKRVFLELRNHRGSYGLTFLIITFAVSLFLFFSSLYYQLYLFSHQAARSLAFTVYLAPDLPLETREEILYKFRSLSGVKEVNIVGKKQVLQELKQIFREDPEILENLDLSKLPILLEVHFGDPLRDLPRVEPRLRELEKEPGILRIRYAQSWLGRLWRLSQLLQKLLYLSVALLLTSLFFLVVVTVNLTLERQREEIEILSLLGASPGYIGRPKMVAAFLIGSGAFVAAFGLLKLLEGYLQGTFSGVIPFWELKLTLLPTVYILLGTGGTGFFCAFLSWLAVQRYFS
ncbi:FtsX-like permease family protein [Thermosulfurimonas marina]|uniref:Cell division protein FtsX n=1 Tax=Thermosulfurimonas marina TaxID=2047767 RepID=A0A6H1WQ79_9BACT|nr:permease-like cell division protein FtsX [Thermosulfurimonas marina]QJA05333.1 FtsX-like permease family protein [Thermosulfurimonas marina]